MRDILEFLLILFLGTNYFLLEELENILNGEIKEVETKKIINNF